jgi:serine/threonine protein kinase
MDSLLSPLVRSMLQYDPAVRLSADEVANHPWFDDVRPEAGAKGT